MRFSVYDGHRFGFISSLRMIRTWFTSWDTRALGHHLMGLYIYIHFAVTRIQVTGTSSFHFV